MTYQLKNGETVTSENTKFNTRQEAENYRATMRHGWNAYVIKLGPGNNAEGLVGFYIFHNEPRKYV